MRRVLSLLAAAGIAAGQNPAGFNYDEAKVPPYTLPDVLGGAKSRWDWETKRRPELLKQFESEMYGRMEPRLRSTVFETVAVDEQAYGGNAVRKRITALFAGKKDGPRMEILLYVPKQAKGPAPVFVGLNFNGNHSVNEDAAVPVNDGWFRGNKTPPRGSEASRWAIDLALERGYAVATVYYGDIDPDFDDGFKNGIHPL
ncbi:MAG: acetylxylan esterase, partial [Bryobacteraceae bacterium]|nr:acetylxylan esterase [Bryobacteraceae bacterium]